MSKTATTGEESPKGSQLVSWSGTPENTLILDSALADWVYHRADNDQGFALGEIVADAQVASLKYNSRT